MNVIAPKWYALWLADVVVSTASNRHQEVKLVNTQMMSAIGVLGVGELIEISDRT